MFRVFSRIWPPPDSRLLLVSSAFDRGAPDDHGAMSVTSGVRHGPEEEHLEVGAPLALHHTLYKYPEFFSFTSLRHKMKSDAGSSSQWNDLYREGAKSTSEHNSMRHQRRPDAPKLCWSPPLGLPLGPDLQKRAFCADRPFSAASMPQKLILKMHNSLCTGLMVLT